MSQNLLEYILKVSRHMAETPTLTPLLTYVLDEAIKLVGAERGYIVLVQADGALDFRVKRGQNGNTLNDAEDQVSTTILTKVVESGQPLVLRDAMSDPHFGEAESVVILGLRSIMCVPLITRGQTIGAVYVENRSIRGRFSDDDLAPLVVFANHAAVSIEIATFIEQLEIRVAERTRELEEAKIQVEQSWAESIEANRMRTVWLSKIAHDLRAPLGIATSTLSFLQEGGLGDLNPQQQVWVDKSFKSMLHMSDLINDLFDLSRLEMKGLTLQKETIALEEFLQRMYNLGLGMNWPSSVDFQLNIKPPLPAVVVDPIRIRQVLLNLLSNAQKFTHQGNVKLHASHPSGQDGAIIGVSDTGEGIAPEKLNRLFERFQQVDENKERRRRGSGLGLAICRELIEMHGGRIWVESTPGVGSNFQFVLPLPSADNESP